MGENGSEPQVHANADQLAQFRQLPSTSSSDATKRKRKTPLRIAPTVEGGIQAPEMVSVQPCSPIQRPQANFRCVESLVSNDRSFQPQNNQVYGNSYFSGDPNGYSNFEVPGAHPVSDTLYRTAPGMEKQGFYNQELNSKAQVQGAVDLSKVRYHYDPNCICGPRIANCESEVNELKHHSGITMSSVRGEVNASGSSKLNLIFPASSYQFPSDTGTKTTKRGRPPRNQDPTFSAMVFVGPPGESTSKVFTINSQHSSNWLQFLMRKTDSTGVEHFWPQNILTDEGIACRAPTFHVKNSHYFMVHSPSVSKEKSRHLHDARAWTDPVGARAQVFMCAKKID